MSRLGEVVRRPFRWFGRRRTKFGSSFRRTKIHFHRLFWNEVDPVVRVVVLCLLAAGFVLAFAGVAMDLAGTWNSFPFSVNMVSSAAAACFGVPIALVVLQYLLQEQQEHSAKIKVVRRATAASAKLSDMAQQQAGDQDKVQASGQRLIGLRRQLRSEAKWLSTLSVVTEEDLEQKGLDRTTELVLLCLEDISAAFPDQATRDATAGDLVSTWKYLDEQLYPMALDAGLSWLGPGRSAPDNWDFWDVADVAKWRSIGRRFLKDLWDINDVEELRSRHSEMEKVSTEMIAEITRVRRALNFTSRVETELPRRLGFQSPSNRLVSNS